MGFFSNLFKPKVPTGHPFPDLYPVERKIERAIKAKQNINLQVDGISKEKWDYLSQKYRQLSVPVTHPFHRMHEFYKTRYLSVKDDIIAGCQISLDELDEENMTAFAAQDLPGVKIFAVRPTIIKSTIAGFRFHGYKNKVVKEMLIMDPSQPLVLEPDPDNKFDFNAVKVLWDGNLMGYVPRQFSSEVSDALEAKKEILCWLSGYDNVGSIDDRTQMEITIDHAKAPRSHPK